MILSLLEPDKPGFDLRTFACFYVHRGGKHRRLRFTGTKAVCANVAALTSRSRSPLPTQRADEFNDIVAEPVANHRANKLTCRAAAGKQERPNAKCQSV